MWTSSPNHLILTQDELHVWRADLNIESDLQESFWLSLSADEKDRASRFRFEKDRIHYVAARGILRKLLANYLKIAAAEIEFLYNPQGKPSLKTNQGLKFNISHAHGLGLFGFIYKYELGIDVEFLKPDIDIQTLATSFFTKKEAQKLLSLPPHFKISGFYNCWTRKEAFIKAIGEGLSFPLDQFEVSLHPNAPAQLLATYWNQEEIKTWTLTSFHPKPDYTAALAFKGDPVEIKYFNWENNY